MRLVKCALFATIVIVVGIIGFVYLAPETATRYALDAERYHSGLERKEIDLPDDLHFVYLEGGQGEPLMLLHGFGGNKDNFTRVARFLTPHYRVIIPDHIGFGESAHPQQADYAPPAQVERLRALAQALDMKALHIGGNSMGGQIAMTYAALYPSEVKSLWLLAPAGVWSAPQSEVFKDIAKSGCNPVLASNVEEFTQLLALGMSNPPFVPSPMLAVLAQERIKNFALEERIFKQIGAYSVEEGVTGMETHTLIVFGEQDRLIPFTTADILHKLLPNSQVIIMPGIGHLAMFERPQQSADDYLRFRANLQGLP